MKVELMDGSLFRSLILMGAQTLQAHRAEVDALNVFPVPDGDTGTNMHLTVQSAAAEVERLDSISIAKMADAVAMGSLMGARGNSGVILSQLFRGFAKAVEGKEKISTTEFARALQEGVNTAYKAVMRPVEGTILTVAKEAAKQATASAKQHKTFLKFMHDVRDKAQEALDKTPTLLPILKQAGVVDAGGAGLLRIYEGFVAALEGQTSVLPPVLAALQPKRVVDLPQARVDEEIVFGYCTEVMVKGSGLEIERLREQLSAMGDSLLVVGTPELVKIHVHTNRPGAVLELCVEMGALSKIKIENMREQHQHILLEQAGGEAQEDQAVHAPVVAQPQEMKPLGVVAVTVGDGLISIFRSLGADEVVSGGQTMNPSTEDIVRAINRVPAQMVVVLPNNGNIIMAAEQAKTMTDKTVVVIPSRSMPQGLAALLALNPQESDPDQVKRQMERAMARVKTGLVTHAVRDSQMDQTAIRAGDYLGLLNGKIAVAHPAQDVVIDELLTAMVHDDDEIVTIYYGQDVSAAEAEALLERVSRRFPRCEVEMHSGGQPVYYYILSAE